MSDFRTWFEVYAKGYDAFDEAKISTLAHCPLVIVENGSPSLHDTPEKVRAFFARLLVWFREIGHEAAYIAGFEVHELGGNCAIAKIRWGSKRTRGQRDLQWPTAYHLVRSGDDWKILSITLRYEAPVEIHR